MRAPVSPGGRPGCEELLLLLLAGRPRLLGDPAPRTPPPYTPSEQALEPWIPGSRKIRLEDADPWSPGRLGGLAPGSPPGALSAAGMWAVAGGTEAAVRAARGFFFFFFLIWHLLPPCWSYARPDGPQKG